jgi:hypothetical protein
MWRGLIVAGAVAGVVIASAPARAQGLKYDEVYKVVQKCNVDLLKGMINDNININVWSLRDATGMPLVIKAAEGDCVEGVKALVNGGADAEITDANGRTALHVAAAMSTAAMVQFLVERKYDIKAKTKTGDTALSLAKTNNYKGKTEQRDKIVAYLTKKGAPDKQ